MKHLIPNFKLQFFQPEYYQWENSNRTVCVLYARIRVANFCSEHNQGIDKCLNKNLFYTFKVRGVSKCDPKDHFNPKIGKKLALMKAKKNAYNKVRKEIGYARISWDTINTGFINFLNEVETFEGVDDQYRKEIIAKAECPEGSVSEKESWYVTIMDYNTATVTAVEIESPDVVTPEWIRGQGFNEGECSYIVTQNKPELISK